MNKTSITLFDSATVSPCGPGFDPVGLIGSDFRQQLSERFICLCGYVGGRDMYLNKRWSARSRLTRWMDSYRFSVLGHTFFLLLPYLILCMSSKKLDFGKTDSDDANAKLNLNSLNTIKDKIHFLGFWTPHFNYVNFSYI